MTTETKEKENKIPQRDDIATKDKWNLTDIYKNSDEWESVFTQAKEQAAILITFAGQLSAADSLFDCLELRAEISKKVSCLYQYAKLSLDLDSRQSEYQEMTDRAMMLSAEIGAASSFIEPELLKMTDEELLKLSYQFKQTDIYDLYIKELIRSRQHIRSEEIEELLSLTQTFANGPEQIFEMLDGADIKYPTIKDEEGNDVQLTKQRFAKFMDSSDPRVRRDASNEFMSVYKEHINTISSTLSTEVNKNIFYTKARNYENALHRALDGDNIPTTVYHSLLDTT